MTDPTLSPSSRAGGNLTWLRSMWMGLPANRAVVTDLMWLHRSMATVSQVKSFNLAEFDHVRAACPHRISWAVAFMKAYSIVSVEFPALRRIFLEWPWAHLYQHHQPVANLVVSRKVEGENWLFFAPIVGADQTSLVGLQGLVDNYQTEPVEVVFKNQVRLARYPGFVRRTMWWLRFHFAPAKRIKRFGTFGLTTLAGQGVVIVDPRAPVTTTLTYGPVDETGRCQVTIAYDHRVMDGKEVADILGALEQTLRTQIVAELRALSRNDCQPNQAA